MQLDSIYIQETHNHKNDHYITNGYFVMLSSAADDKYAGVILSYRLEHIRKYTALIAKLHEWLQSKYVWRMVRSQSWVYMPHGVSILHKYVLTFLIHWNPSRQIYPEELTILLWRYACKIKICRRRWDDDRLFLPGTSWISSTSIGISWCSFVIRQIYYSSIPVSIIWMTRYSHSMRIWPRYPIIFRLFSRLKMISDTKDKATAEKICSTTKYRWSHFFPGALSASYELDDTSWENCWKDDGYWLRHASCNAGSSVNQDRI